MSFVVIAARALEKCVSHINYKAETTEYPYTEIRKLEQEARNCIEKGNTEGATQRMLDIYEICDEHEIFDKRCKYSGCGPEIRMLVKMEYQIDLELEQLEANRC